MSHLILVDGNNLGFSGMKNPRLVAGDKKTQGTFTFIRSIRRIFLDHPNALIMVLWDGRSWRKDIYADYKAKRETTDKQQEDRQEYFDQKASMMKALELLGVIQCIASNMEADDLAEIYSRTWKGDKVTLWSGDKDWLQLVDERTDWYDPILERGCNARNFKATTNFENVQQFVEAKAIIGDKDEVPGFEGVGPKKVEAIFETYGTFQNFLATESADLKWVMKYRKNMPKVLVNLHSNPKESWDTFNFNMKLGDLRTSHRPEPKNLTRNQSSLNEEAFKDLCYEHAFLSFLKDYDRFLQPFKGNKYVRIREAS
jgi:5'-3' exonuclease